MPTKHSVLYFKGHSMNDIKLYYLVKLYCRRYKKSKKIFISNDWECCRLSCRFSKYKNGRIHTEGYIFGAIKYFLKYFFNFFFN